MPVHFAFAAALAIVIPTSAAHADPGNLDLRFGENGEVFVGNASSGERINALLPQAGNAVLAAGALHQAAPSSSTAHDLTVLRLLADGSLDASYGQGGYVQVNLGGDTEFATDLVSQPDGRVLVAGALERGSNTDFAVVRLTEAGDLDRSFGDPTPLGGGLRDGHAVFSLGPNDEARAIAIQNDGSLVVAGVGRAADGSFSYDRFAIALLTSTGEVADSFHVPAAIPETHEYVTAIARRRNGSIDADGFVVAGYIDARTTAVVRRFLANGQPDPQFGNGGTVLLPEFAPAGQPRGLRRIDDAVLQDDGGIVLLGYTGERGFVILRLMPNGARDMGFGTQGRTLVKFSTAPDEDEPAALALQADGKIVAAGYATNRFGNVPGADFASARLLPDGRPDLGYADAGRFSYPLSVGTDEARAVAVMSDGSLLLAGAADTQEGVGGNFDAAFLRLQGDPRIFADGLEDR